ncbi:MAG: hypothetical protein C0525_01470 [Flavobacterium sp.]|uniref:DUF4406 domain-containing protein n=1 Tax=Flavobacterium sp. TaxID=239 RepID=UPI0025C71BDD|nr:DUF4406 domain-containing protein [Flavobacterium sp.]MBA4133370.1 hypothetical protein [Flavobacterium sp.]
MKQSIYIAGKVTGLDFEEVTAKFQEAETMLLEQNWKTIVNPIKLINNPAEEWHTAMEKCLAALTNCEAIYMLPCSVDSPGAKLELQFAMDNNIDIYYELENLEVEPEIL